jgi:2,4-dienoyl-CoA reductase-like NADH-dependent reductase (Old Yellow Enzyme family)
VPQTSEIQELPAVETLLFCPLSLRGVLLRNRVVVSPMLTYLAEGGLPGDEHLVHYGRFATGGAGLVFVEATKVDPRGCSTTKDLGLWSDAFIAPLARIARVIQAGGAAAGIQIAHSGRKARRSLPWEGNQPLAACPGVAQDQVWTLIGPSAVAHSPQCEVPVAMSAADIKAQIEAWGAAAARADAAGFDVLEIQAAHGYLIHQFLSPVANRRSDGYGGSLDNRMRFAVDVVRRVRESWPADKPLFFRLSAVDDMGWTIENSVVLAALLKTHGVDVFDCSSGGIADQVTGAVPVAYGYQVPYAQRIRAGADVMTMAVGLIIHARQAEEILAEGCADLVAIGREMLHNPNWAFNAAEKLGIPAPFSLLSQNAEFWLKKRSRVKGIQSSTSLGDTVPS